MTAAPTYSGHSNQIPFLDGIRGFAALWVVMGHCVARAGCNIPVLNRPALAVDVFIVMSGFLMTYHYRLRQDTEPWESPRTWRTFYVRRFFRIAPLYYLLLIPGLGFYSYFESMRLNTPNPFPSAYHGVLAPDLGHRHADAISWLMHLSFLFGMCPRYIGASAMPDWSIGLEMQFYAVFPFLILLYRRFSYLWLTVLLCLLAPLAAVFVAPYLGARPGLFGNFAQPSFLPFKIALFAVGMLLAEAWFYRKTNGPLSAGLLALAMMVAAFTASLYILVLAALVGALLLYDIMSDPLQIRRVLRLVRWVLSNRLAKFMADTSYGVYLIHVMVMIPIAALLLRSRAYVELRGRMRFVLLFVPVALVSYAVAWVLFHLVEKRGIELGKRVNRMWNERRSPLASALSADG